MIARRLALLVLLPLTLAECSQRPDRGAVVVSAIGGRPSYPDLTRRAPDTTQRYLLDASAQGLVRFDAAGQIEPGLAERWTVIDGGRTYIFRLREAEWANGEHVEAGAVVRSLKRLLADDSRDTLRPWLSAVDDVVEMTPSVIEVRLSRPRPDLLKLFAQPELALLNGKPPNGTGPFRVTDRNGLGVLLRPAFDPSRSPDDDVVEPGPEQDVHLIGESAAAAILRFVQHKSDLVVGGTLVDWPTLGVAKAPAENVKIDPATGLFGLAVVRREGLLASAAGRTAVAEAIDRSAIAGTVNRLWTTTEQLLPDQLDSGAVPALMAWTTLSRDDRLADARARVAAWQAATPTPAPLAIAMPRGPGATLLFAYLRASLRAIGVDAVRVGPADDADLRLIDEVAPYDSARWYLATACVACSEEAETAIIAARDAPTLAERARQIAAADAAMATDVAYIPIAQPLRWSLVAARLKQWTGNPRAWHPLNRLRDDTN